jgi:hypothetical protein
LYKKGKIKVENYDIFENLRGHAEGGGLLTMVHENFEPVLISRTESLKMLENILVVEANLGQSRIRYIIAYWLQKMPHVVTKLNFMHYWIKKLKTQ